MQWRDPDNLPCIEEVKSALKITNARTFYGLGRHNGVYTTLLYYTKGLSLKEIQTRASVASIDWSRERIRQLIIKGVRNARANSNHGL